MSEHISNFWSDCALYTSQQIDALNNRLSKLRFCCGLFIRSDDFVVFNLVVLKRPGFFCTGTSLVLSPSLSSTLLQFAPLVSRPCPWMVLLFPFRTDVFRGHLAEQLGLMQLLPSYLLNHLVHPRTVGKRVDIREVILYAKHCLPPLEEQGLFFYLFYWK